MPRQHLAGRHDFHDVRAAVDTDLLANRTTGLVRAGNLARTEKHTARAGPDDRRARNEKARPRDDAVAKRAPHLERKVAPGERFKDRGEAILNVPREIGRGSHCEIFIRDIQDISPIHLSRPHRNVHVHVDQTGHDELAGAIDNIGPVGRKIPPNCGDLLALEPHGGVFDELAVSDDHLARIFQYCRHIRYP